MTDIEIMQVLIKAKELGITMEDVEAFKAKSVPRETVPELKPEDIIKPLSVFDDISEEEIMYWATPRYDELQAEKELKKQHKAEGDV